MGTRTISGTKLTLKMTASIINTLLDGSSVSITQPNINLVPKIDSGVAANEANRGWQYSGSLQAGDETILNLYNMSGIDIGAGAGKDALGQDIVFENIVAILIVNDNEVGTPGRLEISPAHSNGWKPIGIHTVATGGALKGQGWLLKSQLDAGGFDVPSAAGDNRLALYASGGSVDFSVYILARHDDDESSNSSSSLSSQSSQNSSSSLDSHSSASSASSQSSHNSSSSSSSQSSSSLSRST